MSFTHHVGEGSEAPHVAAVRACVSMPEREAAVSACANRIAVLEEPTDQKAFTDLPLEFQWQKNCTHGGGASITSPPSV